MLITNEKTIDVENEWRTFTSTPDWQSKLELDLANSFCVSTHGIGKKHNIRLYLTSQMSVLKVNWVFNLFYNRRRAEFAKLTPPILDENPKVISESEAEWLSKYNDVIYDSDNAIMNWFNLTFNIQNAHGPYV